MKKSWPFIFLLLGFLFIFPIFFSACSSEQSANAKKIVSVPVITGTVAQKTVPVQLRAIGNVQAYSTVSVRSRVAGQIMRVYFKEGQDVKQGDPLFTIDPRPFEAAVKQAEANLERDMAQVKQAEANLERDMAQAKNAQVYAGRYKLLFERGVIAQQQYDQFQTNWETLDATVRADRAAKAMGSQPCLRIKRL